MYGRSRPDRSGARPAQAKGVSPFGAPHTRAIQKQPPVFMPKKTGKAARFV